MSLISNIKNVFMLTALLFFLSGCGGGGGESSSTASSGGSLATSTTTTTTTDTDTDTTTPTLKVVALQINEPIITENSVTIEWASNGYTSKLVEYGTKEKYDSELSVKEEGTITLLNLQSNTTCHYRIVSEDKNGEKVVSKDNTFVTLEQNTQSIVTEPTPEPLDPVCTSGPAMQQGQIKDSLSHIGLVDVTVTIDGCSTITDENGYYTLQNIAVSEEAVVNFEKEGYLLGSTQIQLKPLSEDDTVSPNYLEYSMHAHNQQWNYDSTGEVTDAHIMIDASVSYRDSNGKSYTGTNTAELTYLNIISDEGKAAFPGAFKGISNGTMVQFETYGLISISLKDSNGNSLNLADGETATLRFDAISSLEKPNNLPLWFYDYEQGLWFEEGYAQLQEDGTYQGEVSHLGTWSLNKPLEEEPGIYRSRIVNTDGTPAQNIRIHAIGNNWSSSDLSTDEDGIFEIKVIPGKSFKLKAYDYKDKYEANYNGSIAAIASGEIAGN